MVLEQHSPGGQAGSSMRIENYLGFPTGLTGRELADRATLQAHKFGAQLSVPAQVASLEFDKAYAVLRLEGGETVTAKCLLVATGAHYRRLEVEGCEQFEGRGVYYAATPNEAQMCRGADVVVVGGGNSAGQAAVFLASHARRVLLVIRGDDLSQSMSRYLASRIEQTENIELLRNTTIRRMDGDGHLAAVEFEDRKAGTVRGVETPAVFSFIGAIPRADGSPPRSRRTRRASSGPARSSPDPRRGRSREARSSSRRAAPGSSPRATSAPVPSSAWPRRWARAPWRCSSSTNT